MKLREALDQTATAALRRMAALHGLPADETTTRAELAEALHQRLGDSAYLRTCVEALVPEQRRALAAARAGGGEIRGFLLARILGSAEAAASQPLLDRGFLFRTFAPLGPHRGELFAVPDEVLDLLQVEMPDEHGATGPPLAAPPPARQDRRASDPVFSLFALASFLQRHLVEREDMDVGAQAAAFRAEVEAWAQEPGGWPWQERWAFFRHLALGTSLLGRRPDGTTAPSPSLFELLSNRPRLVERLWRAYLRDRDWSELVRGGVPQAEELAGQVDAPAARDAVVRAISRLPAGTWLPLDAVVAWLERAVPTFLREQLDSRSAALLDPDTGQLLLGEGSWERVEARLIRYLLLGPFYWLGVIGTDQAGTSMTLTPTGEWLLGRADELPSRPVEPCSWEGGPRLDAPARADLGVLLQAERYLHLTARGQPSRYGLERDRVAAALSTGGSVHECRELLQRLSRGPLPEAVAERLAEWESRFGALVLRPTVVLEARTAADLEAAQALDEVKTFVRRALAPNVAEIPASHALDVARALRAAGHLPQVDAALRLMSGRKAYAALVDEHVLEFLLVSLLAFQRARPEQLAQLEGSLDLLDRLEGLFPPEKLETLRLAASRLAGELHGGSRAVSPRRKPRKPRR